jgi:tetratricopeptide (TPR) repeat protein
MSDAASGRSAAASAGSFVGTFALILAVIAALFAIDVVLAEKEREARGQEARRLFEEGLRLERGGSPHAAVDRLRSAVSAARENPLYQRALAAALHATGRPLEAQAVLTERLQHDPVDAEACLIMARTLVQEHKVRQAIAFYHRAIYGQWEDSRQGGRLQARFELVDLLARENARQELLAELLPLQTEAPRDISTRKRIGRLFIAAGSPARAREIFRDVLRRSPDDGEAYAGLGEAEFQAGNYRAARADLRTALRLRPDDHSVAARLELSEEILSLDPTARGIGAAEQQRRSVVLLERTLRALDSCATASPSARDQATVDSARARVGLRVSARRAPESVEENVDFAERVWQVRGSVCPAALTPDEQPVELVLDRLAQ